MTVKQFKVWLVVNDYNHTTLAEKLGITPKTISNYISNGRFPKQFIYALKGVENESL